jgi:Ni/Fe-hydrogenase subunit HybB-like protein
VELRAKDNRTGVESLQCALYSVLTLGAWDISPHTLEADERAVTRLASIGIPVACFLHGYAGFIFGSVKANALWMTPLMPVIFICSAVVSGIALCILTYVITMELRKILYARKRKNDPTLPTNDELKSVETNVVIMTSKYLVMFLVLAISLELLDLIFRTYTAVKSWDILRAVIYEKDFFKIFILQYGFGNVIPFIIFLSPGLTVKRAVLGTIMVLIGVFMMRWNVVIGGQAFSGSFSGFMEYAIPIIPHDLETFKEGLCGALMVIITPYILFFGLSNIVPIFGTKNDTH